MVVITVIGVFNDPSYYYCESIAKRIEENVSEVRVECYLSFEMDYWARVDTYKNKSDPNLMHYYTTHLVVVDDRVIGDSEAFATFASQQYGYAVDVEVANTVLFNRNCREGIYEALKHHSNPVVYIEIGQQDLKRPNDYESLGALYIELFADHCPKASENFKRLCEGDSTKKYKYAGCLINRLVRNGWFQTGDVIDNTGKNSVAAEGESVPDECFTVDFNHWRGGVVGYANEGAHTNRSQFFVTLGACPWMNHKFVGVGRVIQGFSLLRKLNNVATNNQVPARNLKILECGVPPELKA